MRFAPDQARVNVPETIVHDLIGGGRTTEIIRWIDDAAKRINKLPCAVVFQIGKLRLSLEASRALAFAISDALCEALKRLGSPEQMKVEVHGVPADIVILPKQQVRTLLPHHDGGRTSYLTPSILDDPTWEHDLRRFSEKKGMSTATHKMYQGFFVADPGEGLSITPYYDWLEILKKGYTFQIGPLDSIVQLETWLGQNIRASLALQESHKGNYLTLGAALGVKKLIYHAITPAYAEADFSTEETIRFPELQTFQKMQTSNDFLSPTEHFLSQVFIETLGLTWGEFLRIYEICVPTERFDLLFSNNLGLVHGALMGGPSRQLDTICMVMDAPVGDQYENWLAKVWRRINL